MRLGSVNQAGGHAAGQYEWSRSHFQGGLKSIEKYPGARKIASERVRTIGYGGRKVNEARVRRCRIWQMSAERVSNEISLQ